MKAEQSRVYFLKPVGKDGPIKIGCSILPDRRLEQIAVWSPWPLELMGSVPGTIKQEMYLHQCFAKHHSHREWFHSAPDVREAIAAILVEGSLERVIATLTPTGTTRKTYRRKWSACEKECNKYRCAIRATMKRLRKDNEGGAWHIPEDIYRIMDDWGGNSYRKIPGIPPNAKERARLDAYLADPVNHSVVPSWRRPKDPICIPVFGQDA